MVWQLNRSSVFDVCSFYKSLLKAPSVFFPWQCIWSVKVPRRVSFFLWKAARGGILTIDNLVKKNLPFVNWCCLCWCEEETVDHLLLHCKFFKFVHTLWSLLLVWGSVGDAKDNSLSTFYLVELVGHSFFQCLEYGAGVSYVLTWEERNAQTFEDNERTVDVLKSLLTKTLFEWSHIWCFMHCTSLLDFN